MVTEIRKIYSSAEEPIVTELLHEGEVEILFTVGYTMGRRIPKKYTTVVTDGVYAATLNCYNGAKVTPTKKRWEKVVTDQTEPTIIAGDPGHYHFEIEWKPSIDETASLKENVIPNNL